MKFNCETFSFLEIFIKRQQLGEKKFNFCLVQKLAHLLECLHSEIIIANNIFEPLKI